MTENPSEFDPQRLSQWVFARAHPGWLGMKYHAHGENWVEVELPWRADLIGDPDFPVLASGPIISLLDMASGMSIWATNRQFRPVATLDLRVDYQRPARDHASVIGHAECYKQTRSAAFVRGVQSAGAVATAKHFPGHGDTDTVGAKAARAEAKRPRASSARRARRARSSPSRFPMPMPMTLPP